MRWHLIIAEAARRWRVGSRPDQLLKNVCAQPHVARLVADIAEHPFWIAPAMGTELRPVGVPPVVHRSARSLCPWTKERAMPAEQHSHEAQVHQHEHTHVTHYLRHGEEWAHLTANHDHEHNHAPLTHSHQPHEDPAKEHQREAHVHDHEQPARSPA
jgi:hypothetical protein